MLVWRFVEELTFMAPAQAWLATAWGAFHRVEQNQQAQHFGCKKRVTTNGSNLAFSCNSLIYWKRTNQIVWSRGTYLLKECHCLLSTNATWIIVTKVIFITLPVHMHRLFIKFLRWKLSIGYTKYTFYSSPGLGTLSLKTLWVYTLVLPLTTFNV